MLNRAMVGQQEQAFAVSIESTDRIDLRDIDPTLECDLLGGDARAKLTESVVRFPKEDISRRPLRSLYSLSATSAPMEAISAEVVSHSALFDA